MEVQSLLYLWDGGKASPSEVIAGSHSICKLRAHRCAIPSLLYTINFNLPDLLSKLNIQMFVPLKRPSFEFINNKLYIVYYHDQQTYRGIMQTDPINPHHVLDYVVSELYRHHKLAGPTDRNANLGQDAKK